MEFSNTTFDEAEKTITLRKIRKALRDRLARKFPDKTNEQTTDITHEILRVHGLHKDNFDYVKTIEQAISERINDISIDDNSNKNEKTIKGTLNESVSPTFKAVGYDYLFRVLKQIYGKREAKRLSGLMYDFSLGLSDSTNILIPYCWAMDASKLVTIGRDFGQLQSKPAKRISSYISALCETIHQISSHLAGAVAIGTFFLDIAHLGIFKEKFSIEQIKNDPIIKKYIENEFQQFIHSVNHLSRMAAESPFTNVSIFDKTKLNELIKPENMGWYFMDEQGEIDIEYCIDYIIEIQNIYLDLFDKGDPLKDGLMYRFPVSTVNVSKQKTENGFEIIHENFLDDFLDKYDISKYNIFASEGTKTASCCRLLSDSEMLDLAGQSNSFGGTSISLGSHRVVTTNFNRIALECDSIDDFYKILDSRVSDCAKILKSHKTLIQILADAGLQSFIKNGWINMDRLFSTYGILGVVEAVKTLNTKFEHDSSDLMKDILVFFNDKVKEYSDREGLIGNIEQIPGESYAVRLASVDRMLYSEEKVPYQLYSNQFVPLWEDATMWEKLSEDGKYNQLLTGGGIVHAQIAEKVTKQQAKKIINYSVQVGCEHFALNCVYNLCLKNHLTLGNIGTCSVCGDTELKKFTRVVGFMTEVDSWNKTRREWEFPKRTFVKFE